MSKEMRDNLPEDVQSLHHDLLREGQEWRSHLHFSQDQTVPLLMRAVMEQVTAHEHASDHRSPTNNHKIQQGERMDTPGSAPKMPTPTFPVRARSYKRIGLFALVAAAIVGLVGTFLIQQLQRPPLVDAPPRAFVWSPASVMSNMTPQEAFAHGVTLTLCQAKQPPSKIVTWLATNPNFGLAFIQEDCNNRHVLWLFNMFRRASGAWDAYPVVISGQPDEVSANGAISVPNWLPLPRNTYSAMESTGADNPGVRTRGWLANHQYFFIGGTIAAPILQPAGSEAIVLTKHAGWQVQQNGLTILLVPNVDGHTYFFVGDMAPQDIQPLADAVLTHTTEWSQLY